jgi:hypothetical protein
MDKAMSQKDSRPGSPTAQSDASETSRGQTETGQTETVQTGRRSFLKYAGFAFAAVALPESLVGCGPSSSGGSENAEGLSSALDIAVDDTKWIEVVRREDMLRLRFNFLNMTHSGGVLTTVSPGPGVILVEFPPQHIVEPTVLEPVSGPPLSVPARPIDARIASPSRLAFKVPAGHPPIKYSLEDLLDACTQRL